MMPISIHKINMYLNCGSNKFSYYVVLCKCKAFTVR